MSATVAPSAGTWWCNWALMPQSLRLSGGRCKWVAVHCHLIRCKTTPAMLKCGSLTPPTGEHSYTLTHTQWGIRSVDRRLLMLMLAVLVAHTLAYNWLWVTGRRLVVHKCEATWLRFLLPRLPCKAILGSLFASQAPPPRRRLLVLRPLLLDVRPVFNRGAIYPLFSSSNNDSDDGGGGGGGGGNCLRCWRDSTVARRSTALLEANRT
jgi:hypothetical protein